MALRHAQAVAAQRRRLVGPDRWVATADQQAPGRRLFRVLLRVVTAILQTSPLLWASLLVVEAVTTGRRIMVAAEGAAAIGAAVVGALRLPLLLAHRVAADRRG